MKIRAEVDGAAADLEFAPSETGWQFQYGGVSGDADVREVEPGVYSVLCDGRTYNAVVEADAVRIGGRAIPVRLIDPRELQEGEAAGGGSGRAEIRAPMPGKVIRVLVDDGAEVTAGQGLIVVEAMKMQNEMQAPRAGRVTGIRVEAGAAVSAGQVLMSLEASASAAMA